MNKKNILIVSHAMEIGGVERALIGLLDNIDYTKYSVDLFLFKHSGELLNHINSNATLLPQVNEYACLMMPIIDVIKKMQLKIAFGRVIGKFKAKQYVKKNNMKDNEVEIEYSHKYTKSFLPMINPDVNYDLAISFLTPHYIVSEKTAAKKKIAWIHTDYSQVEIDKKSELNMWSAFDNIISISDDVSKTFVSTFPSLKDKIKIIENIQPELLIKEQVKEFDVQDEMSNNCIKLLSIGRFTRQKNFNNIPFICKRLIDSGKNVKWYLIGYGSDEISIRKKIHENNMEHYVIILGKKENPYPYIKTCDLYVQPSLYEGKCVAVREAQMLCKPVVITNYATCKSQLEDQVDGIIVPMDNDGCANGIIDVLNNKKLMSDLVNNCNRRNYSNSQQINKLYSLIN